MRLKDDPPSEQVDFSGGGVGDAQGTPNQSTKINWWGPRRLISAGAELEKVDVDG